MKKKRLAYIDYWSHKYTKSGDFLREILSEEFEITDFGGRKKKKYLLTKLITLNTYFFFMYFSLSDYEKI